MKHLDLCSGIGGFSLAAEWMGWQTVAFCERDEYCQAWLAYKWPGVPLYDDLRTFDARPFRGAVDILTAGYPCQPFSKAGQRKGAADDRHLWPAVRRVIAECRPTWVVCENVAGHITLGLDEVLADLEAETYTCWPIVIPACAVDAVHRRDRVWIIANAVSGGRGQDGQPGTLRSDRRRQDNRQAHREARSDESGSAPEGGTTAHADEPRSQGRLVYSERENERIAGPGSVEAAHADDQRQLQPQGAVENERRRTGYGGQTDDCHTTGAGLQNGTAEALGGQKSQPQSERSDGRQAEPGVRLRDDGFSARMGLVARWMAEKPLVTGKIPLRVQRLKAFGNAIVPQIALQIFRAIEAADL